MGISQPCLTPQGGHISDLSHPFPHLPRVSGSPAQIRSILRCQSSAPKCIEMLVIQVTATWKGNDHGENHDQTNGWGLKKSPISFSNKPKWGIFKFQGLVLLVFVCYIFLRFIFGSAQTQRVSRLTNRNSSPSMPWIRCYFLGEDLWDQQR